MSGIRSDGVLDIINYFHGDSGLEVKGTFFLNNYGLMQEEVESVGHSRADGLLEYRR